MARLTTSGGRRDEPGRAPLGASRVVPCPARDISQKCPGMSRCVPAGRERAPRAAARAARHVEQVGAAGRRSSEVGEWLQR